MDVIYTMSDDILTLAAIVAAFVGVARGFGISDKWTHLVALVVAAVFVLIPEQAQIKLTLISVVALTASGAYSYVKKRDGAQS